MRAVWRYADILEPGIQSVIVAGTALMLVLCADNLDLHIRVYKFLATILHTIREAY